MKKSNPKIILATTSPFRKEAFGFLEIPFKAKEGSVDENFKNRPKDPKKLVLKLAELKAQAVADKHKKGIIIGFDSVGYFQREVLEKPKSKKEAFERLKKISGEKHYFYTGACLIKKETDRMIKKVVVTEIWERKFSDREIKKYLKQDPNYKKIAMGFDPFGHYSVSFARKIQGSYNNYLRGIPLEAIVEMLKKIGYKI
jgi:MAF protein